MFNFDYLNVGKYCPTTHIIAVIFSSVCVCVCVICCKCYFVLFTNLKKDSWRADYPSVNRLTQRNFEQCEMGQLLAYLFRAITDSIQNG